VKPFREFSQVFLPNLYFLQMLEKVQLKKNQDLVFEESDNFNICRPILGFPGKKNPQNCTLLQIYFLLSVFFPKI
jgi:hypothetical protein